MRNVILLMHVSLDGFVAGPNGEMGWIHLDDGLIDYVADLTATADTALFGRVTYQMMEGYWPDRRRERNRYAARHRSCACWVNPAPKIVFSRTLEQVTWQNSSIVRDHIPEEIARLKGQPGKDLLMIGSASTAHTFMQLGLIDEYRINVNPVVLGGGMPLFPALENPIQLELISAKTFDSGVVGLHYQKA